MVASGHFANNSDLDQAALVQRYSIYVDARMIRRTGIGRHIREHVSRLATGGHRINACVGTSLDSDILSQIAPSATVRRSAAPIYGLRERLASYLHLRELSRTSDVFWFPQYNTPWMMPTPSVVTIHDLIQFRYNLLLPEAVKIEPAVMVMRRAVAQAARVVCVSRTTRCDLVELIPSAENKIHIVPNGVSLFWSRPNLEARLRAREITGGRPFFLAVGVRKPHKNFRLLLHVIDALWSKGYREHKLLIVGEQTREWIETLDRWNPQWGRATEMLIDHAAVTDDDLAALYQTATICLVPSLYEGFGLTALEAMMAGTPVIAANRAALPETVGEAGVLLDPINVEEWTEEIASLVDSPEKQQRYVALGRRRAEEMSWRSSSEAMLGVLRSALDQ